MIPLVTNNKFKFSFVFASIFSVFDLDIPNDASTLVSYSKAIFILSLVALICFINLLFYFSISIFIQRKDYENKYPKFSFLIKYYKNVNIFVAILEILLCFIALFIINVSSLLFLIKSK